MNGVKYVFVIQQSSYMYLYLPIASDIYVFVFAPCI